jgi:ribosomal protein L7Ae-like RNA K-turn-binding protein
VTTPGDLAERVEMLLRQRCCDLIGLARRAGRAVAGFEKVRAALRKGEVAVLVAAADGGDSGRDKLRALAVDLPLVDGLSAAELGGAFGRDHVVHAALAPGRLAREALAGAARLATYRAVDGEFETTRGRHQGRRRSEGTVPERDDG